MGRTAVVGLLFSVIVAGCSSPPAGEEAAVDVAAALEARGAAARHHPDGWGQGAAHGFEAEQGLSHCSECHCADLSGGRTGVACSRCHGGWTNAGAAALATAEGKGSRDACGSCHGRPPRTGRHLRHQGYACYRCHDSVIDGDHQFRGAGLHVNGQAEVRFSGGGAYDAPSRTCSSIGCHGAQTW